MTQEITSLSSEEDLYRNSTKSRVSSLSKLSHELKNPIHGISGIISYLEDNWDSLDDKSRRTCLASIKDACDNLTILVSLLIRCQSEQNELNLRLEKVDLVAVTKLAIDKYKNLHVEKNHIVIKLECEMNQFFADVDEFWYRQLLVNLLSNSANYSDSGTITIRLSLGQVDDRRNCVISVKDQGIGIPESELETIFEPFIRSSKQQRSGVEGIGLGLTICREIVEKHGGAISASNNPDVGTTIEFYIPASEGLD